MSINYDYIFKSSKKIIPNTSGMCSLIPHKIDEYCKVLRDKYGTKLHDEVKYILDSTVYLSFPKMCSIMDDMFDKFKRYIGNREYCIIIIDVHVYKSEHLWIQYLWSKIEKTNCVGVYHHKDMIPCDEILWIDDVSYSGGNLQDILRDDVIGYKPKKHMNIILCGASDNTSYIRIKHIPTANMFIGMYLPLYQSTNDVIQQYFWIGTGLSMVYLDYKIATIFSTYAPIYHGIVPSRKLNDDEIKSEPIYHEDYRMELMETKPSRELLDSQQY